MKKCHFCNENAVRKVRWEGNNISICHKHLDPATYARKKAKK